MTADLDADLARQANEIAADLMRPEPRTYWLDLGLSAAVLYAALVLAVLAPETWMRVCAGAVAVFALYRAESFIHELSHFAPGTMPVFKFTWNALVGVPFLAPSFLYEGVHNVHHITSRYGTVRDPEYLPLTRGSWGKIVGFVAIALLAPVGVVLRFAVLAPLSFVIPRLRTFVVERSSAMVINPVFRREDGRMAKRAPWLAQEIGAWAWCWAVIGLTVAGVIPWVWPATWAVVLGLATFINQIRTLGAHAWDNDGAKMSFIDQFRDSVNVPPPAVLPALWAPVGLRYHALHHLMPRVPYHNLGKAHRRLLEVLPPHSAYHTVQHRNLGHVLRRLAERKRLRGA